MGKQHDDWLRSIGFDPDKYLINADAGTPAARGADTHALQDKIAAGLDELDAQSVRLKSAGIEPKFLDKQIADLRTQYGALTKPGQTPAKSRLEGLEKTVLAAV